MDRDAKLSLKSPGHHSGVATFAAHGLSAEFQNTEECEVKEISTCVGPLVKDASLARSLISKDMNPPLGRGFYLSRTSYS